MYKKQFSVQTQNLLSKKDLKGLKTQLVEQFPGLEEKDVDHLLPEGQVKVLKLDNRCLLYAEGDKAPVFFDAEGRGDVYPTMMALWQYPYMMPELTIHPPVSKFVLNGADLMLPGVLVPANGVAGFGAVSKGQKRCIKIEGNPYPIAIGKMLVNQTQMEKLKGKGLEVLHVYKDALWAYAGKAVPNAGFVEKDDEVTPCSEQTWVPGAAPPPAEAGQPAAASEPAPGGDADDAPSVATPTAAPGSPVAAPQDSPKGAAGPSEAVGRAPADWSQDDLLDFTFMQAFKLSLTDDKSLPVEASELYEKHMKPARPDGTTLDVKKSAHKQIGKFLNAMRKAKAIDVTEKKGVISVSKVDRGHKLFKQLEEKFAGDAAVTNAAGAAEAATPAAAGVPPPVVSVVWKPTHYLEGLFKAAGKKKDELFSWDSALEVLRGWIEKEGLRKADGRVKLNEELITMLYRAAGAQKKDQTWPEEVDFSDIEEKLQDRMQEHTIIEVAGVGSTTRKGPPSAWKIEVSLSRKGAHNVTRICNLEAYGLDVQALSEELKKKMSCTVHVEDMPGKNTKDKMMQLQGHVQQELGDFLLERYGITKSFLSVK